MVVAAMEAATASPLDNEVLGEALHCGSDRDGGAALELNAWLSDGKEHPKGPTL